MYSFIEISENRDLKKSTLSINHCIYIYQLKTKTSKANHACDPSRGKEARGSMQVQGQPGLHSEFQDSIEGPTEREEGGGRSDQ